jgi:hypothetical protein
MTSRFNGPSGRIGQDYPKARTHEPMSRLTEAEYEEYIGLLSAWVDAEKALEGVEQEVDAAARERSREAYAAVRSFRAAKGLELGAQAEVEAAGETRVAQRRNVPI